MTPLAAFVDLLQCPRCRRAPLVAEGERFACGSCRLEYPAIGGLPWLFADAAGALGDWRNRLTLYLDELGAAERVARADLAAMVGPRGRLRVQALADAYRQQATLARALLEPLALARLPLPHATPLAFQTRLPLGQDLHSYYANLHRDWCWGEQENDASHRLVADALGAGRERVLVLGAGACRLAYDLHQRGTQQLTVALDINPLLLLAAERIVRGAQVELYEFPIAPRAAADAALRRSLAAPAAARPGLQLLFADAWRAPFRAQAFDAVVTPWLIDIADVEPEWIAGSVNRLLAPGGRWVNFGSLAFPWRRPALRPDPDELVEIVTDGGFGIVARKDAELPYMRSPVSRHARLERVFLYAADKVRRSDHAPRPDSQAAWLLDHSLPVPSSEQLQLAGEASRIQAILLALVDGQRSIGEIARIVTAQGLLPADEGASAVTGLLEQLHERGSRGILT